MLRRRSFGYKNTFVRILNSPYSRSSSTRHLHLNQLQSRLGSSVRIDHAVLNNSPKTPFVSLFYYQQRSSLHNLALSSIWEKNEHDQQLYTGSSKAIFSTSYYRLHARKDANFQEYFDRVLAQRLLIFSPTASKNSLSFSSPFPQYAHVSSGDLVECSSKSGSYVAFGVIITQFSASSHILVFGLDGQLHKIPATNIKLHIAGVFDGKLILEIFAKEILHLQSQNIDEPTTSKPNIHNYNIPLSSNIDSYDIRFSKSELDIPVSSDEDSYLNYPLNSKIPKPGSDPKYRQTLLSLLRLVIRASLERYERGGMRDAFSVMYAHASSDSVRTFSLDYLTTEALNVLRKASLNVNDQLKISSKLMHITSKVATHFYLSNSPQNWYAFPPTVSTDQYTGTQMTSNVKKLDKSKNGKWIPAPTIAAEDSLFVRHGLNASDWSFFGQYIRRVIVEKIQQKQPSFKLRYDKSFPKGFTLNDGVVEDSEIDAVTFENFSKILGVLKRYIVYPHQEYEDLVKIILETVYGYNNLPRSVSIKSGSVYSRFSNHLNLPEISASSVHQMLIDANLVATNNAYLDSGLILDYDAGNIVDEYSEKSADAELKSVIENEQIQFVNTHKKWNTKKQGNAVYSVYLGGKTMHSISLVKSDGILTGFSSLKKSLSLELASSQLAFSVEDHLTTTGRIVLHIHIPNIASWYSPTSSIMTVGLRRARTVWLPEGIRRLFPEQVLDRVSFTESIDSKIKELLQNCQAGNKDFDYTEKDIAGYFSDNTKEHPFARCLTFSANIDPNDLSQLGPNDVNVSLTRILKQDMTFLDLEKVSEIMKWKVSDDQTQTEPFHSSSNANIEEQYDDDIFGFEESEKLKDSDPDNIFVSGDNEGIPISETPLGWMRPEHFSQSNNFETPDHVKNSNHPQNHKPNRGVMQNIDKNTSDSGNPAQKLFIEADNLSIQTHKDLTLIRTILESNYWKRMKEYNAVYETDTDEYGKLVTVGSKNQVKNEDFREANELNNNPLNEPAGTFNKQDDLNRKSVDIALNCRKSRFHLHDSDFLISESGLLAAEIASVFGASLGLPLLYEKQDRIREFDLGKQATSSTRNTNNVRSAGNYFLTAQNTSTELRDESSLLTHTGRYLAATSQYLGPKETTTSPNYIHFGLGIMAGFVGVARPFDDMRHVINQWQFTSFLISNSFSDQSKSSKFVSVSAYLNQNSSFSSNSKLETNQKGSIKPPWRLLSNSELQLVHDSKIYPRANALSQLELISQRYWVLRQLEQEIQSSPFYSNFHDGMISVGNLNANTNTLDFDNQSISSNDDTNHFGHKNTKFSESVFGNSAMPHIFRCVVVSPKTAYPDFARAYCVELGLEVDIMPPPPSRQVHDKRIHKEEVVSEQRNDGSQSGRRFFDFFDKIKRDGNRENMEPSHSHESNLESSISKLLASRTETSYADSKKDDHESKMLQQYYYKVLEKVYGGPFGEDPKLNSLVGLDKSISDDDYENSKIHHTADDGYTVLKAGDRIICTSIIDLDPTRGHLVLGI